MWTDTYCFANQCGASSGGAPVGAPLFSPDQDAAFAESVGGMIWPRGFVGAAAFWNFNATADPSAPEFVASIYKLNDDVKGRGGHVCATNCSCDQLTQCGKNYIRPYIPAAGDVVAMAPCADADALSTGITSGTSTSTATALPAQTWIWEETSGNIAVKSNPALCLASTGKSAYPLVLKNCSSSFSDGTTKWARGDTTRAEIVYVASGQCLDLKSGGDLTAALGTYECGSGQGLDQPNQHWAFDTASGNIVSLATGNKWLGQCVSVVAATA